MSYHDDLLEQARHLTTREPGKPKQVSLRRAVSDAYYGLFHLLITEGAKMLVDDDLRALVQRSFNHGEMKSACKMWTQRQLPEAIKPFAPVPPELLTLVTAFMDLQDSRHEADYDFTSSFSRTDALDAVAQAEQGVKAWQAIRALPITRVFLASLVFGNKWNR